MRVRLLPALVVALALVFAGSASAAPPFKATLTAPTHTPKVNAPWRYSIRVTDLRDKPIPARVTVQVIDPFGMAHPVQFGSTARNVVNWAFFGVFRDFVKWPPESRGFQLTLRATVSAKGAIRRLTYPVRSR